MNFKNVTKTQLMLLVITLIYLIIYTFLYLGRKNYEFLVYIGVVILFLIIISFLHFKYNFTTGVLAGLSIWGFLHMSGGYFKVGDGVLYSYWIFPFLRYDMFVHAFGFGFATLLSYYMIRNYIDYKKVKWISFSIFLVLIGIGIGGFNEIIEFILVIKLPETGVGGYNNTMGDMVFNTIGAIIAVVYLNVKKRV
ncbi:MAG: DUF2238 domain-containing protein [Nanoarchaeota archaeon]|nr:DUF2238 domain-containing protein [Nanoarchaeota archaeon]